MSIPRIPEESQKPRSGFPAGAGAGAGFTTGFGGVTAGGGEGRCGCDVVPVLNPPLVAVPVEGGVGAAGTVVVVGAAVGLPEDPADVPEGAVARADGAGGGVVAPGGVSPMFGAAPETPLPVLPSEAGSVASSGAVVCDVPFALLSLRFRIAVLMMSTAPTTPAATDTPRMAAVTKRRRRAGSSTSSGGYSIAAEPSVAELVALGTSESPDTPMLLGDETSSPCDGGAIGCGIGE
jgi:hypothetical protein